jgi:hypothetical protein
MLYICAHAVYLRYLMVFFPVNGLRNLCGGSGSSVLWCYAVVVIVCVSFNAIEQELRAVCMKIFEILAPAVLGLQS